MPLASADRPLARVHDLAMLDLDGVVYVGAEAVPGARTSLAAAADAGMRIAYLTNNASRRPAAVADHLRELGMPLKDDDDVVTSAQAVSRLVADAVPHGATVLLVGGEGLQYCLHEVGLSTTRTFDAGVRAVVQGFSPDLTWTDLAEASFAVHAGVPWFASNTDLTFPATRGTAPGNGSLVQAVANATQTRPVVAGKPERALFEETLTRLGPSTPLMVGDRLDTDIEGAIGAGIPSLAVLTGVSTLQDLAAAAPGSRPDFVGADLGALLQEHPPVRIEAGTGSCSSAQAHVVDGTITLEEGGEPLHRLRAVLGLAWGVHDDTGRAPRVPDAAAVR